jgi:CRISPR-associated protein Cst1
MEQERVGAIRALGDRLADEIAGNNDRRLLRAAYMARDYRTVRRLLLQADLRALSQSSGPLLSLDDYLLVFEEGTELARADWRLAWDLVLIRLIEQLHQRGQTEMVTGSVDADEIVDEEPAEIRDTA